MKRTVSTCSNRSVTAASGASGDPNHETIGGNKANSHRNDMARPGTAFILEVTPKIPQRLARLEELANNLGYSWDRPTRELFARLHQTLWDSIGHSPKAMLRRIDERQLLEAAEDPVFLNSFNRILSAYDTYHGEPLRRDGSEWLRQSDRVAYF